MNAFMLSAHQEDHACMDLIWTQECAMRTKGFLLTSVLTRFVGPWAFLLCQSISSRALVPRPSGWLLRGWCVAVARGGWRRYSKWVKGF